MRLLGVAAVAAILLVACTSESAPTTQLIIDVPDIPEVPGPTTTVDPPEVSTTIPPRDFQTVGSLPDGTPFSVFIETPLPSTVEAISAGVMVEIDGVDRSVGAVSFGQPQGRDDHFFHHGVDLPPGGGIQIDFDDDVLEALGPDYNGIIAGSIRGTIIPTILCFRYRASI